MNVKTNIRAGSGGSSGTGHNSGGGEVETQPPQPVYVPPVSRCVGI